MMQYFIHASSCVQNPEFGLSLPPAVAGHTPSLCSVYAQAGKIRKKTTQKPSMCQWIDKQIITWYSEPLKSTNLTEFCQISLGRRWIRKSNKLTKSKVNPNGTPMYDKLCFGKFCCVKKWGNTLWTQLPKHLQSGIEYNKKHSCHIGTQVIHHM